MKKKYQIFVSSTFEDLKDERQAVNRAILNLGHIPAGMELFPAADIDQFSFIKKVIDDCDYYVLIIGGRYGSTTQQGLSYTELEYKYAKEQKIPILAFLHSNISELKAKNVDADKQRIQKLNDFRDEVSSSRLVEFWDGLENLESKVVLAATNAFNENPQMGWSRGDGKANEKTLQELNAAKKSSDLWYKEYRKLVEKLENYENLETAETEVRFIGDNGPFSINTTGETLIKEFAVGLNNGLSEDDIVEGLISYVEHNHDEHANDVNTDSIQKIILFFEVFELVYRDNNNLLKIPDDKKWLLKAAFKPLKKVISEHDDEIPF
ncbi:MAG: DUF4062 domain-containing protein [Amylibacter sp.]|nr:DUF4062 domain-containing protein [Amylibacter sp.]